MTSGRVSRHWALSPWGRWGGAWLLYVLVEAHRTGSPMPAMQRGGLVFFGAPLGAVVALFIVRRALHIRLGRYLDLSIPAIPAAHAMGRIGCLLGGCCYGEPYAGALSIVYTHPLAPAAHPAIPRHPVPLYEAGGLIFIALQTQVTGMRHASQACYRRPSSCRL